MDAYIVVSERDDIQNIERVFTQFDTAFRYMNKYNGFQNKSLYIISQTADDTFTEDWCEYDPDVYYVGYNATTESIDEFRVWDEEKEGVNDLTFKMSELTSDEQEDILMKGVYSEVLIEIGKKLMYQKAIKDVMRNIVKAKKLKRVLDAQGIVLQKESDYFDKDLQQKEKVS